MVDARPRDWHETHLAVNEIRVRTGWQDVVSDIDAVDWVLWRRRRQASPISRVQLQWTNHSRTSLEQRLSWCI